MRKILKRILYGIVILLFLSSGLKVGQRFLEQRKSSADFKEAMMLVKESKKENLNFPSQQVREDSPLDYYGSLLEVNADVVGWIEIKDTHINYPVVQSKEKPDFYLTHGLDKKKNVHGVPYVDSRVELDGSTNTILYAHQMKDGSMFTDLNRYLDEDFYRSHPIISFNTLNNYGEYEIISVFKTSNVLGVGFPYYNFIEAQDSKEFNAFISQVKTHTLYETGESAKYGDQLLTLSTCEYTLQEGRLVVVAKKIMETP